MNLATVDGESLEGTSRRYILHMYVSMTLKEGKGSIHTLGTNLLTAAVGRLLKKTLRQVV